MTLPATRPTDATVERIGAGGILRPWMTLLLVLGAGGCAPMHKLPSTSPDGDLMARPFVLWPEGKPLPSEGYDRSPQAPFEPGSLVIRPDQMRPFYGPPGEFGYYIDGVNYDFESLSFILTETHPGGGPDLHQHDTEEAHVLFDGTATYLIGDRRLTVQGPYIVRIPAGVPHTFLNAGKKPFHLMGVFPHARPVYKHIGPNPLIPQGTSAPE